MVPRLPAVTRLLAAALLAAAFTSGAFQDDENLMFDDEDGLRSEAPVAVPSLYGVLGSLSRPKRQSRGGAGNTTLAPEITTYMKLQCLDASKTPQLCDDGVTYACFCDGSPQCPSGEDEALEKCPTNCPPGRVPCGSEPTCIETRLRCDGFQDCRNNWDEEDCNEDGYCADGEFQCTNRQCIRQESVCDRVRDCYDGSDEDEVNCPPISPPTPQTTTTRRPCQEDQFQCGSGECIPLAYYCDGPVDCQDRSDEDVCTTTTSSTTTPSPSTPTPPNCRPDEFKCNSGDCVPSSAECDGKADCSDGSDEGIQCPPPPTPTSIRCNSDEFECQNGQCIPLPYKCDGIPDCPDLSDEEERVCSSGLCSDGQVMCNDGACIEKGWVCDSVPDCSDGGDELNCCKTTEFKCGNGSCIPEHFRCDWKLDCADGSDEHDCGCRQDQFQCNDGDCVPRTAECDNRKDCRDGSDEGAQCTHYVECPPEKVLCGAGHTCIETRFICDGFQDCRNSWDEENCPDRLEGMTHQLWSGNTKPQSVALGLNLTLECHLSLPGPVSFMWVKRDGTLPADVRADNAILDISNVQVEDAGYYACTSWNSEMSAGLSTLLIVTDVVPRFNKSSYLVVSTVSRFFSKFDIEITFKPESHDGLILYISQKTGPDMGHFVSFGLIRGYPEFRFNVAAEPAIIRGTQLLETNQWHTVKLSLKRRDGIMIVNGGDPVVGWSEGRIPGMDMVVPLFLDGVPDFQNVHRQTGITSGFKGCIRRLVTGNTLNTDLMMNAVKRVGVTSCETCASNPCLNNGVCQEANNERGYKCFCAADYHGELCEDGKESCYEGMRGGINLRTIPQVQTSKQNQGVIFFCRDEGTTRAPVRWVRDGGRHLPSGSIDLRGELTMPNIQMEHQGVYYCVAQGVPLNTPSMRKAVYLRVEPY